MIIAVFFLVLASSSAFNPRFMRNCAIKLNSSPGECGSSPSTPVQDSSVNLRKSILPVLAGISAFSGILNVWADEATAVEAKLELGPVPDDFGITNDYYGDCARLVKHMRYACQMEKGNPNLAEVARKTKDEMNDFVASYRRFNSIAGKQTFSLLYTSISVLAGHYTSYGLKFPVPEKRRKRLLQELNDIEKNIKKKR